jgi:hypothetical protein
VIPARRDSKVKDALKVGSLQNLGSARKKTGTLFQRVMGDLGLLKIADLDRVDVAVDLQISRFTFYTGVLKPIGTVSGSVQEPHIRSAIEKVWRDAARNIETAPWKLDQPI